jgi:hypothetical protein
MAKPFGSEIEIASVAFWTVQGEDFLNAATPRALLLKPRRGRYALAMSMMKIFAGRDALLLLSRP